MADLCTQIITTFASCTVSVKLTKMPMSFVTPPMAPTWLLDLMINASPFGKRGKIPFPSTEYKKSFAGHQKVV